MSTGLANANAYMDIHGQPKLDKILRELCSVYYFYSCFCPKMASDPISEHLIFKKFPGGGYPRPHCHTCIHTHQTPSCKNSGYGPGFQAMHTLQKSNISSSSKDWAYFSKSCDIALENTPTSPNSHTQLV